MEPSIIKLNLATNCDLHEVQPMVDENGVSVNMTGWPFSLQLKFDENDVAAALTVTVTVSALGELTFSAAKATIAALLTGNQKKRSMVGDLLTKPNNGTYLSRLARVEAVLDRGVSIL